MKKTFTKLAGGIMAASMILGTAGVAAPQVFADDTYDITVTNGVAEDKGTHEYKAYQIFAAKSVSGSTLTDITWGNAIAHSEDGATASFDDEFAQKLLKVFTDQGITGFELNGSTTTLTKDNIKKAAVLANALSGLTSNTDGMKEFARVIMEVVDKTKAEADAIDTSDDTDDGKITVNKPGYYIVEDTNTSEDGTKDTYTSEYMVEVAGNVTMTTKGTLPKSNKTVTDDEDKDAFGNKDIDDKTSDTADYDIGDKVPFTLYGSVANNYDQYTEGYYYSFVDRYCAGLGAPEDITVQAKVGNEWKTIAANDATGYKYIAPTAVTGDGQYVNEFKIEFANLQNVKSGEDTLTGITEIRVSYKAELLSTALIGTETGNPNKSHIEYSNNPNSNGKGESKDTEVVVFTYGLKVDKVDGNEKPLAGAKFKLMVKDGDNFVDYKNGTERESVPVYEEMTDITGKTEGVDYVKEGDVCYTLKDGQKVIKYYTIDFKGLDEGTYKLVETVIPDGYNKAEDIEFTITAAQTAGTGDAKGTDAVTVNHQKITNNAGNLSTTVVNNTGATLPSTGGIGTTIFYIVGAAAAVTAIVLLTTRRRANKED